jgi:hypothetical protein
MTFGSVNHFMDVLVLIAVVVGCTDMKSSIWFFLFESEKLTATLDQFFFFQSLVSEVNVVQVNNTVSRDRSDHKKIIIITLF